MTDYSNYREWKEVSLYTKKEYFSEHEKYSPEEVYEICKGLISISKEEGLEGCFLRFESNREPYEDFLGSPSITPCGYRKLNQKELEDIAFEGEVEDYAKEKNIPIYKATQILTLKKEGLLDDL